MMELREEYKAELAELETKMIEAQKFAEKFPAFASVILENKWTKEFTGKIASNYKGLYFGWGICRLFYREREHITNYRGDFDPQYLWCIYINSYSLFGEGYEESGLREIKDEIDLFFFDHLNTTFYATDDQIMTLLDALAKWYEGAKVINDEHKKETRKRDLLKQLEALE